MPLLTRENPATKDLEVLVDETWVSFQTYRTQQIDDAYSKSVQFLRERLGEDDARKEQEILESQQ